MALLMKYDLEPNLYATSPASPKWLSKSFITLLTTISTRKGRKLMTYATMTAKSTTVVRVTRMLCFGPEPRKAFFEHVEFSLVGDQLGFWSEDISVLIGSEDDTRGEEEFSLSLECRLDLCFGVSEIESPILISFRRQMTAPMLEYMMMNKITHPMKIRRRNP